MNCYVCVHVCTYTQRSKKDRKGSKKSKSKATVEEDNMAAESAPKAPENELMDLDLGSNKPSLVCL